MIMPKWQCALPFLHGIHPETKIIQKVTRIPCFKRWGSPHCATDNSMVFECCEPTKMWVDYNIVVNLMIFQQWFTPLPEYPLIPKPLPAVNQTGKQTDSPGLRHQHPLLISELILEQTVTKTLLLYKVTRSFGPLPCTSRMGVFSCRYNDISER